MTMGQRITQRRKQLGLSQEALADAVGVSRQAVSKWELDEAQPDAAKIVLLAQALEMTTDELLLGEAEEEAPAAQAVPTAPRPDHLGRLEKFVRRHGYKAGYILIAWGLALLLFAGAGFLMFRGFFAAADESYREFSGFQGDLFSGWSGHGGVQFDLAPGVSLSPDEIAAIEEALQEHHPEEHHFDIATAPTEVHAFSPTLQRAVYVVLALPAIFGGLLVVTGVVVIVKYKGKDE